MNIDVPLSQSRPWAPSGWLAQLRLPTLPGSLKAGLAIVLFWSVSTVLVPLVVGRDAEQIVFGAKLQAPSAEYLFGTDSLGRDVLVRTVIAFRYDLLVSLVSVIVAAILGVLLGALAGSTREWIDNLIMRIVDILQAFPSFVLAIVLAVALGTSVQTLIFSIALVLLPLHARGTRAAILSERSKPYADAARAMAIPPARILFVHLLPNSLRPTLTQMAIDMSNAIMITSAVSFLGFGIQSPTPEWGLMMNEGGSYIVNGQWWVTFFPGLGILSIVLAFFLIDLGVKRMRER